MLTTGEAPAMSLSAHFGLDAQPLHTDGAHLRHPPEVIALHSTTPNRTPTLLWSPTERGMTPWLPEFAQVGVFTVRNGRDSFLASAAEGAHVRFDPVCMSPADDSARQTVAYFAALEPVSVEWDRPDMFLLFDNRKCLHARAAVEAGDEERQLERRTYRWETPQ